MTTSRFANTVIIVAIGYLGFLLFLAARRDVSLFYQLPLIIIIVALVASLKIPERFRVRIMLVLLSAGVTVLLFETVLEITDTSEGIGQAEALAFWEQADFRSHAEITQALRADGIHAYPYVFIGDLGPTGFELNGNDVFPVAGISQTTTVWGIVAGEILVYESDEHGFHSPSDMWGRDDIDIVSVGDSFTWGADVAPNRNATALITSVYPNTLNLGWPGTGPFTHFAIIKEYVGHLKPKVVLWFYYEGNDTDDLIVEPKTFPVFSRYLNDPNYRQNLMDNQAEIDRHLSSYVDQKMSEMPVRDIDQIKERKLKEIREAPSNRESMSDILRLRNTRKRINNSLDTLRYRSDLNDEASANLYRLLTDSRAYIHSWGGELYLVYLPSWVRYAKPAYNLSRRPETMYHDDIMVMAKGLGIPFIDVKKAFDTHPDPLSLWPRRMEGHYNEDGYRLVAETVLRAIQLPR